IPEFRFCIQQRIFIVVVQRDRRDAIAVLVQEVLHRFLDFRRGTGQKKRVPVKLEFLASFRQYGAQNRLALENISGVLLEQDLIDVEVRIRMIPQIRSRAEPEIQNLAQSVGTEFDRTAFVYEPDQRDFLGTERLQQFIGHLPDADQTTGPAITAAQQIVDHYN